jgi:hypothetical protein
MPEAEIFPLFCRHRQAKLFCPVKNGQPAQKKRHGARDAMPSAIMKGPAGGDDRTILRAG